MPRYLFSGTNPQGKPGDAVYQSAADPALARQELTAAGWTELELHSDDIILLSQKATREASDPELAVDQPAAQELRGLQGRFDGFLTLVVRNWVSEWKSTLMAVALLAVGFWWHRIWMVVGGAVWLLVTPALVLWAGQSSAWFDRLQLAKARGQWNEVIHCVEKLRGTGGRTGIAVPEYELERNHAVALAGMGRLDDALEKWAPFCGTPEVPEWLFLTFKAGLLETGKEMQRSLETRMRAAELKPDQGTTWIDLAMFQAMRLANAPAARDALARARQCELPAITKPYLDLVDGLILWRENDLQAARPLLERALAACQTPPNRSAWESITRIIETHLGIVAGLQGDQTTARRLYEKTRPYLEAHRETDMLAALRSAVNG